MRNPLRAHPTIATVSGGALVFLAVIYVPPMLDSPKEAVRRGLRECGWAIQTNSSVEPRCQAFVARIEQHGPIADTWMAGDVWMQVAEYRLVQGDVAASKQACHQAVSNYNILDESAARLSNKNNAMRICDALFVKYGP